MQKWEYHQTDYSWLEDFDISGWMWANQHTKKDFGWNEETQEFDTQEGSNKWMATGHTPRQLLRQKPVSELNREGEDGWELVTLLPSVGGNYRAYWKRPLTED